jgi:8-oxo-dGTP pyrophosphatase MutT (NUDIX family)
MKKHYETPSAIILMLLKVTDGKKMILLQKRKNTGFADGLWDLSCSGHVEYGESMTATVIREAREELGVDINRPDVKFVTMIHKRDEECDVTYYNGYFVCANYKGEPHICEPDKCSDLKWFDLDKLPTDMITDRKEAIQAYFANIPYIEFGWQEK